MLDARAVGWNPDNMTTYLFLLSRQEEAKSKPLNKRVLGNLVVRVSGL